MKMNTDIEYWPDTHEFITQTAEA